MKKREGREMRDDQLIIIFILFLFLGDGKRINIWPIDGKMVDCETDNELTYGQLMVRW